MNTKINIKEIKNNKGWYNITTVEGQQIAVNTASNPQLTLALEKQPITLDLNLVEKNGKFFGWDIKDSPKPQGGFHKLTPEQAKAKQDREDHTQRMIVAQNCVGNAVQFYQQRTAGIEDVKSMAKDLYNFVIELSK